MMVKKQIKFIFKYRFIIILLLALISRVLFVDGSRDFFDSMQYVWRSNLPNLQEALIMGHAPFHPGYMFFTYIFNYIFRLFGVNDIAYVISLPSAIFGSLTILVFAVWVEKMFNTKTAILSAILLAITPYFWISNITILVDSTMIFFYILSLYLYYIWLKNEKLPWLILSGLSFGFSMWAHTQIAFWVLGYIGLLIAFVKYREIPIKIIKSTPWVIGPIIFILLYLYLLKTSGYSETYIQAAEYLFAGNTGDRMSLSPAPSIRNYTIIMTILGAVLSFMGFIKILISDNKKAYFLFIWLVPGLFISSLYLYANLYGRASMIAIFPSIIAISYLLAYWQPKSLITKILQYIFIILIVTQFLYISVPIVITYATNPGVYEELDSIREEVDQGGVAIISKLQKTLSGHENPVVVFEMTREKINQQINIALEKGKPVFFDMDAYKFPYFQYDGHNWEIKSTKVNGPGEHDSLLAYLFSDYNVDLAKTSRQQNKTAMYEIYKNDKFTSDRLINNIKALEKGQTLIMGRVIDNNLNKPVGRLLVDIYSDSDKLSRQRINHGDWLYQIYYAWKQSLENSYSEPINWTHTDKSGYYVTTIPQNEFNLPLKYAITSFDLCSNDVVGELKSGIKFVNSNTMSNDFGSNIQSETINIDDLNKLVNVLENSKSYQLAITKNGDNNEITYYYSPLKYELNLSDNLEAEKMPHTIGVIKDGALVSDKDDFGVLTSGPWVSLPEGEYQVSLKMKITDSNNLEEEEIGFINITAENSTKLLKKKIISTRDFDNVNEYKNIIVSFRSQGNTAIEFVTKSFGEVSIWVDSIKLNKK